MGDSPFFNSLRIRYRTLRALKLLSLVILGLRFASPQVLCLHLLRGFWKEHYVR
jgi:hypothetical protein